LAGGEHVDSRYLRMPWVTPGMVVGLFGGSFNPPHDGHVLVADIALRRLGLDQLWWMVTPGNPLKSTRVLAPLSERIRLSEAKATDPRVHVTAFEKAFGENHTFKVLGRIKARNPGVHFVWIMGADNLATFHKWQNWRGIADMMPIAVIDRPGATLSFLSSTMAKTFDHARIDEDDASLIGTMRPPVWTFVHGPRSPLSSTAIRQAQNR
jgi:nicotinate-nucleotide adenylyltransferase